MLSDIPLQLVRVCSGLSNLFVSFDMLFLLKKQAVQTPNKCPNQDQHISSTGRSNLTNHPQKIKKKWTKNPSIPLGGASLTTCFIFRSRGRRKSNIF